MSYLAIIQFFWILENNDLGHWDFNKYILPKSKNSVIFIDSFLVS